MQKRIAREEALFFEEILKKEINKDREAHGKRPLKEKDDDADGSVKGSIKMYLLIQCRLPVIRTVWESTDGDESQADLCMYEPEETGKDEGENGADRGRSYHQ